MACLGCCKAMRPRYKRLVDDIFPVNPEDGLVKNNMDKLTFYALSSPEKLDRIGEYLASKLSRDVYRRRITLVKIAMDALDQLLVSCHDYSLNLFVESFLKMVQKLLECDELELQVLGTLSFVKYANIEEDTPSYHRRYDFFVSKFSAMIRTAGLKGIQGVVRKTITDELQVNIWEPIHMDKIVPSLLYNMHDPSFPPVEVESPREEEHPAQVAETVFRDLICRASYNNLKPVLRPILLHMDNHSLWTPNTFVTRCFKIVMYSVQDKAIRTQEKKFEEALINTIGQFANNLPDYQKIEIMMFVMAKFPQFALEEDYGVHMDAQLQTMLLKTLLKVATKYKTVNMSNAFPQEFLQPLLRMSLFEEAGMRIIVQEILHTLIDRHENSQKFKHYGMQIYWYLCENVKLESNKVDNFEALFCTMALITAEMGCRDIVADLVRLALDMQISDMLAKEEIDTGRLATPFTQKPFAADSLIGKEEEEKRRFEIIHTFQTAPFEEIVARSEAKSNLFHNKLNEILSMVTQGSESPGTLRRNGEQPPTVFDIQYPELYVY
ncbi:EFR3A-like protein [Mya arenaria]|uniref:EFR3A-like protein n=1 Tax=Mya arenaria TaxID=6604 RepID=A0ABY7FV07_MYAAR|nr:EFR3A-like protein [Mya arenaria]